MVVIYSSIFKFPNEG
uniref:Uncharacterized protein n=1 Tax=Arundo donax TaxID=35708 RepID=A0A0A9AJ37_ARUDO